jgi:hypothetical protein
LATDGPVAARSGALETPAAALEFSTTLGRGELIEAKSLADDPAPGGQASVEVDAALEEVDAEAVVADDTDERSFEEGLSGPFFIYPE